MKSKYLYLAINALSFGIPFLFSLLPAFGFVRKWKYIWPAILANAVFFILWDVAFAAAGVWGFNERYITGLRVLSIPVEEIMFFICIPYACLFTYFALNQLIEKDHLFPHQELITSLLIVLLLIAGVYNIHRAYAATVFLATGLFLAYSMLKLRMRFMGRFYVAFAALLIPFFVVNGYLTGLFTDEPVVWYNHEEILGIRIGTIPVEDAIYAMLMIVIPITICEKLEEWRRW